MFFAIALDNSHNAKRLAEYGKGLQRAEAHFYQFHHRYARDYFLLANYDPTFTQALADKDFSVSQSSISNKGQAFSFTLRLGDATKTVSVSQD